MTQETKTIREMCADFDVTPRALRFYESKELLFPIREGTRRLFTRSDRARLKLILRGKRFGFSLEQIRQLLDLYNEDDGPRRQLQATVQMGAEQLRLLEKERDLLSNRIEELKTFLNEGDTHLAELGCQKQAAE